MAPELTPDLAVDPHDLLSMRLLLAALAPAAPGWYAPPMPPEPSQLDPAWDDWKQEQFRRREFHWRWYYADRMLEVAGGGEPSFGAYAGGTKHAQRGQPTSGAVAAIAGQESGLYGERL